MLNTIKTILFFAISDDLDAILLLYFKVLKGGTTLIA